MIWCSNNVFPSFLDRFWMLMRGTPLLEWMYFTLVMHLKLRSCVWKPIVTSLFGSYGNIWCSFHQCGEGLHVFFYMQADVEIGYLGCWSLFQLMLWYWCAKSDCPKFFINQRNESALLSLLLFNQQPIKIPLSIIGFYNLHTGCAVMESTSLEVFILYSTRYYFKKCTCRM
jgi:hypothetical protein